ncbi:MAG: hypothetical protein GF334_13265 [Candidatus Altiarchaeales archaeon]|nr:hypothetical protein [Candidatus Altiarchaeales archaeon]
MRFRSKLAHLIRLAVNMWSFKKELMDLTRRFKDNSAAAAKEVLQSPQKYPILKSIIIPLRFFSDKLSTEMNKHPRDIIMNLDREIQSYLPLTPEGLYPEEPEEVEQSYMQKQHAEQPVSFTPAEKEQILAEFYASQGEGDTAPDKALHYIVNLALLKKVYEEARSKMGQPDSPLAKKPGQLGWKAGSELTGMARRVVVSYIQSQN